MKSTRLKGSWNIIKGKLKQKCAKLAENDSRYAEGREEELVGRLKRLGKTRTDLEQILGRSRSASRPRRRD
jgi:uncharacterized protein YjbJ (UPF0337 family)